MANRCLIAQINERELPQSLIGLVDYRLKFGGYPNGLGVVKSEKILYSGFQVSPELIGYENINGGNPEGSLVLGNFVFQGSADRTKISDLAAGLSADGWSRIIIGDGRHIDLAGRYFEGKGVSSGLGVANAILRLCSSNHVLNWTYLDYCYSKGFEEKIFEREDTQSMTVSLSKIYYASSIGTFGSSLSFEKSYSDDYWQDKFQFVMDYLGDFGYFAANASFGEPVAGKLVMRQHYSISWSKLLGNYRFGMALSKRDSSGGSLLGFHYVEKAKSINFSLGIGANWVASIGQIKNDSNIDYFDYSYPSFSLKYTTRLNF